MSAAECECGAVKVGGSCPTCDPIERRQGYKRSLRGKYGRRWPDETETQYRARLSAWHEAAGTCTHCKRRPADAPAKHCRECLDESAGRREDAEDAGLCARCRKRQPLTDRKTCAPCIRYISDRAKARREAERTA